MKKSLRSILSVAAALALALFVLPLQASHLLGSEITYTCIGPNIYIVNLKLYRDCTGASAPTTASLTLSSPGCNGGRSQAMTKIPSLPGKEFGTLYCPQVGNACSTTTRPNYQEAVFTTTVTFSAAEAQCPDWYFSWTECCRPTSTNLVNASGLALYAEAYTKLSTSGTAPVGVFNNSPQFPPVLSEGFRIALYLQPTVVSMNATDPDGDSLVYSMAPALSAANTPIGYAPLNVQGNTFTNPQNPSQTANLPAGPQSFSPTFPIASYQVDWNAPAPRQAVPAFSLDPQSGSMKFTPAVFVPGTTSMSGANKYVVVVQVDEYRKINGVAVKVGHVRRDMHIVIDDPSGNVIPVIAAPVANGQPLPTGTFIDLRPGTPLTFTFTAHDPNLFDELELQSDVASILPGATFTATTSTTPGVFPTGTVTWTPTAAHVRGQAYFFRIIVKDNACPINGKSEETIGVRVAHAGRVTGLKPEQDAALSLTAYPNPFNRHISFKVDLAASGNGQEILIYNVLGQQVDRISLKGLSAGQHTVKWNSSDKVAGGHYIARLANGKSVSETIQFIKAN